MDVLGNGPSELCSGAYIGFLKGGQMFAGHTKGPGPNMFSCFSTVKQNKKTKKQKFYLLTKGALFLEGGGGAQGAIAPRHPGPVRPCRATYLEKKTHYIYFFIILVNSAKEYLSIHWRR